MVAARVVHSRQGVSPKVRLAAKLGPNWQIVILENTVEERARWMHEKKEHFRALKTYS